MDVTVNISPEMLNLIAEIDEFKGGWRAFRNLAPERLSQLRWVATVESVASSTRIEGSKLSDKEVETLIGNLRRQSFRTRDEQEVAGYAETMEMIFESHASIPLTENHIRQLHQTLLKHSTKDERHRGNYKNAPNHVEARGPDGEMLGVIFETASPFDTPREMEALLRWTNQAFTGRTLHPLLITGVFIVWFLAIHPFQDGNGRLSRILTMLMLLKQDYAYVPYSSMESIIEQSKESYYLALRRTQSTLKGADVNWQPWLDYFLRTLKKQKDNLLIKIEREQLFLSALPELSLSIVELARQQGRITAAEAELATRANRHTIKKHLQRLTQQKVLQSHGRGRATWYTLI